MTLFLVDRPHEAIHRAGNGKREHYVRHQNTGKEKHAHARGETNAGIESGALPESPQAKSRRQYTKRNRRKRGWDSRGPIMNTEDLIRDGDGPVNERRLLEINDTIQARRH